MDLQAFVARHRELLQQERDAEVAQVRDLLQHCSEAELEERGVLLRRLQVADLQPAFGGSLEAVLQPTRTAELPEHRFQVGDVVGLAGHGASAGAGTAATGVLTRVRRDQLIVCLDDPDAELPPLLRLDRLAPDITFRRLQAGLRQLGEPKPGPAQRLRDVCFHARPPGFGARPADAEITWCNPDLDPSQRAAVLHALRAEDVAVIHGPPGTGKTTAVVELIQQAVQRGLRVLASAPSNVAVDNLTERLARRGLPIVRIGHPARLLPAVRDHALAALVEQATEHRAVRELRREMQDLQRRLGRATARAERAELRGELRALRNAERDLSRATVQGVLDHARVVLCTTTGAADAVLGERTFDLVVLDEAAQALEAAAWLPLLRSARAVLAGDHWQLAPTVLSEAAARAGLATTLMERLALGPIGPAVTRMLTTQYRMHRAIMGWSSARLYDGELRAAEAVAEHLLADLPGVADAAAMREPLVWLDTAGCGHEETPGDEDGSKSNPGEAALVARHVRDLLAAGVPAADVAVITPYRAQVRLLRELLAPHPELEIGTVDGLQGREKEAVVLSLVRSNDELEIGFLREIRRLNVAVTRARRHLCIVGDSATLAVDPDLGGLLAHCGEHGVHRSAFELGPESG